MATVTGLTAARMLAIEAATVVGGTIDGFGHLILSKHDGSTVDAGDLVGAIGAATETMQGTVELATNQEVADGTDTQRAVTPAALASIPGVKILTQNSKVEADPPSAYPSGVSMLSLSASPDWSVNSGYGNVVTFNNGEFRTNQIFYNSAGGASLPEAWLRCYNSADSTGGWTLWAPIMADDSAYRYLGRTSFGSSGVFNKADYPNLRAIKVLAQAGGGAGGGSPANTSTQKSFGSGGGGGGSGEAWILAADLEASVTVTVGSGGVGVSGAAGGGGGGTSFGTHVVTTGGFGGDASPSITTSTGTWVVEGDLGGYCTAGNLGYYGESGTWGVMFSAVCAPGVGGSSYFGGGGRTSNGNDAGVAYNGADGRAIGSGGGGSVSEINAAAGIGGNGVSGAVIVEIYV